MTAIVAEGDQQKLFLPPIDEHVQVAKSAIPEWRPRQKIINTRKVSGLGYGMAHWHQLFTNRQIIALNTFSTLLSEIHNQIAEDGAAKEYADAVRTYLVLAIGRTTEICLP